MDPLWSCDGNVVEAGVKKCWRSGCWCLWDGRKLVIMSWTQAWGGELQQRLGKLKVDDLV